MAQEFTEDQRAAVEALRADLGRRIQRPVKAIYGRPGYGPQRVFLMTESVPISSEGVPGTLVALTADPDTFEAAIAEARFAAMRAYRQLCKDPESLATTKPTPAPPVTTPTTPESLQTFTGDQAVTHPVIRAAIIAGHEVAKTTGRPVDPVSMLILADASVDAAEAVAAQHAGLWKGEEALRLALVERVLIAMMTGAINAVPGPTLGPE